MAIYDLFDREQTEKFTETFEHIEQREEKGKSHFFSTLVTRLCFFLLLLADLAWLIYSGAMLVCTSVLLLLTGCKNESLQKHTYKFFLSFRRSAVCGLSLFVGLFSPPFGIMVACTYFLMYDKKGMEEVVPAPLQAQFKDIFKTDK